MESKIFQDIPEEAREAMLEANAYTVEEQELEKHFSHEEVDEMRKEYMDNSIAIRNATAELNRAKDVHKAKTADPTKNNQYLIEKIKNGFVLVPQTVYLMEDHTEGMIGTYDRFGNLISSRRMKPEERQTRIK